MRLAVVLAVLAPAMAIVLWGIFAAPKSSRRLPCGARVPFELCVFGLAVVALFVAVGPVAGIAFAIAFAIVMALNAASAHWVSRQDRDDKAQRREKLRRLDFVLSSEVEQAGAMSLDEFQEEVRDRELLGRPTKTVTVKEWWDYATRRGVLEDTNANSARLTDFGRQEPALARRRHSSSHVPAARATLKYVLPSGIIATGVTVAEKSPEAAVVAAIGVLVAFVFLFWLVAEVVGRLFAAFIDPWLNRKLAAINAAWLDGDEVKLGFRVLPALPAGTTMQRLYEQETLRTRAAGPNLTLPPNQPGTP